MALTAVIIGAATALYSFIAIRTADSISRFSTLQACQTLTTAIGLATSNATSVTTRSLSGVTALVCTVPDKGVDRGTDGLFDYYWPTATTKLLRETYGTGKRIWFYPANSTGTPGTTGNYWFMAIRNDTSAPTLSDVNSSWSFWNTGQPRVQIIGTVTFAPVSSSKLVRVRILTSPTVDRREDGGLANSRRSSNMELNQRFFWRGSI